MRDRAAEVTSAIEKATMVFNDQFDKTYKKLFPYFYSKLLRRIRKFIGLRYFRAKEVEDVRYIGSLAFRLAELIDQRIINEHGQPM